MESYEHIRDNSPVIPQDVRNAWKEADGSERLLRGQYERLIEDGDLTDEAKARRAGELYEKQRPLIERRKQDAKDALIKASKSAEHSSMPKPRGESLTTNDPTRLLLSQNEASRIVSTVERRRNARGPFQPDVSEMLRDEYRRGIELSGTEGAAVCSGVLRASRELGIPSEEILNPLRDDRQREMLDNARRLEHYAGLIATDAPKPPKSLSKAAGRGSFVQSSPVLGLAPAAGTPIAAGGGSHNSASKRTTRRSRKNFS